MKPEPSDNPARVLFICTGNYYRSRFAEACFNHYAAQRGLPWRAESRGLAPHLADGDLSILARAALEARGIPLVCTAATRRPLTEDDLRRARRVVALDEAEHRPLLASLFPAWAGRVTYWDAPDVALADPAQILPRIEQNVLRLLAELSGGKDRT